MESRKANIDRHTGETQISVAIDLDGVGDYSIKTGNGMFDHLLAQLSRHGLIDLEIEAQGDMSRSGGTTWSRTPPFASDAPFKRPSATRAGSPARPTPSCRSTRP